MAVNVELSGITPAAPSNGSESDAHEKRIKDLMIIESLTCGNPLVANVGVVNAKLMLYAKRYGDLLDGALQQSAETLTDLDDMVPRIDGYLRITKLIERFSMLQVKFKATTESA